MDAVIWLIIDIMLKTLAGSRDPVGSSANNKKEEKSLLVVFADFYYFCGASAPLTISLKGILWILEKEVFVGAEESEKLSQMNFV